jgi:chemotaxis protein CheX
MILGNVKTTFEETLGPMGLSIPTVIYGRNFTTRSVGHCEWSVVPFELDGDYIEIQISLAKRANRPAGSSVKDRLSTVVSIEA